MKNISAIALLLAASITAVGGQLSHVRLYNGAFIWVKLGTMPAATVKSLSKAKSIVITVTFTQRAVMKKDSNGNTWFTFILSDQSSDWKWHQTTGSGSVPLTGGVVKPG